MSRSQKNNEPKKKSGFGEPVKYESRFKFVAWFRNYWYYYKAPVIIIAIFAVLGVWFIHDVLTNVETDFRMYTITNFPLSHEQVESMEPEFSEYITDIDGDGEIKIVNSYLNLAEEPADEQQAAAYQQIMTVMVDDTVTLMLIDDEVYRYLSGSDALEKLSTYGLTGVDDYRIRATGSFLLEDTQFGSFDEYYLVFRVCIDSTADDPLVQARYDTAVQIASAVAADTEQVLKN